MVEAITHEREPSDVELRALVDAAPCGIFVADARGHLTFVNATACRLLGRPRGEIVGRSVTDVVSAEEVDRLRELEAQMLGGGSHVGRWKLRRQDGGFVPVELRTTRMPDGQWQIFVQDLSNPPAHEAEPGALQSESDRRQLQRVIDPLPLGVLLFQPDGRLLYNRRAEEMLGVTLSPTGGRAQYAGRILDMDGRRVPDGELPSDRVLRGETVVGEEYTVERPDGSRIPVLATAAPILDGEGHVVCGVGIFQGVSDRMRLDYEIRMNERLLQGVFEILPIGVWVADRTGRLVRHNPAGKRIWGGARMVSPPEFGVYKGWWVDSGKPIRPEQWGMARAVAKGEASLGELIRIQCFDGSFKTILHSAAPLRDEQGEIAGAIVVNEDITALHEAQEKQRASEQLLRTVFDLLPVGVWVTDREGKITLANPAGERIWGATRYVGPELYSEYRAWWLETGELIEPEAWAAWRAIRRGETSRDELIRIQCFDGSFKTVINFAAPIRSDAGEIVGAIAVNEDVTSLQHTQEQLRAAVRDREEILAIVAHDLRAPLQEFMTGASATALKARDLPGGEPILALATTLVDISRRMSGLVDDLLAIGVATAGGRPVLKLEPIPASSLLARATEAARPLFAKASLQLEVGVSGELPLIRVDVDRILRVFANLLSNALKFTSAPGRITVAGEVATGGVLFSVANTGPPVPPEKLRSMFQPFWQAAPDRRGTGLGLAICRSIVEAHGGTIWAEPTEGERVRVYFFLPRRAANA